MSLNIIVKNYAHINRSFSDWDTPNGKIVRSKDHYERLMAEQGMVSFEQGEEIAEKSRKEKIKPYKLTEQSKAIIASARMAADKKGNVKLGDRAIDALIQKKAINKKLPEHMKLPSIYNRGGFYSSEKNNNL